MYIYSRETIKNSEIIGDKMLLTYLYEDEEKVSSLIKKLDNRGLKTV